MNLKKIRFSVLLPILERNDIKKLFPLALKSIYMNTLLPSQVVVVVDGLVSNSFKDLVNFYSNYYSLDLIWTNKKIGLDKALNLGLSKCVYEYIFRADGDDINLRNRFEKQLPFLLEGFDVVGSNIDEYDEEGKYISTKKVPLSDKEIEKFISYRNPINHMSVGYLKQSILEVGGYPELFLKGDYGLWIKLKAKKKKFKNLEESLVKATTGNRMIKDRGGLKYIYSEIKLQKFLLSYKMTNIFKATFVLILRSIIFIIPFKIRNFFYFFFLREVKKN